MSETQSDIEYAQLIAEAEKTIAILEQSISKHRKLIAEEEHRLTVYKQYLVDLKTAQLIPKATEQQPPQA